MVANRTHNPFFLVFGGAGPIPVVPEKYRGNWGGEECDAAELPNGDLLFVFRRYVPELKTEIPSDYRRNRAG